jgi:capsid protein
MCDYSGMENLNLIGQTAFKTSKIGGDTLVVLRVVKGVVKVQLIDGCHIESPLYGTEEYPQVLENGNTISCGIERKPNGEVVAYYIRKEDYSYERIPAKNSLGFKVAYLVYGAKYRIDNVRGIPVMSTVLESLKKLERYKEATLGSAEEGAKIAYQIVHDLNASGENPLATQLSRAFDADAVEDLPVDRNGQQLANTVAATTNKSAFNMPTGSEIKQLEANKRELYFKDFYGVNIDIMCAAIGIPPNVAMSIYNDSFSASRAALKDWEHTIKVNREDFTFQFYQPIFDLWLHVEVLKNKVQAPGYLDAFNSNNEITLSAYRICRFTGAIPGHIDPLKEVNAVRAALGGQGANIPLMTVEMAIEQLNGASSDDVAEQFSEELQYNKELGIEPTSNPPV